MATFVGGSAEVSETGVALSLAGPPGAGTGDLLLACTVGREVSPAGWVQHTHQDGLQGGAGSANSITRGFSREYAAGPHTFTSPGTLQGAGVVCAVRDPGGGVVDAASATATDSSTSHVAPSVTAAADGSILICVYICETNWPEPATGPPGMTLIDSAFTSSSPGDGQRGIAAYWQAVDAGPTGDRTLIWDFGDDRKHAHSFVIGPEGGGSGQQSEAAAALGLTLGLDTSATKRGATTAGVGVEVGLAATVTKRAHVSATFVLDLSTSAAATKYARADAGLGLSLDLAATADGSGEPPAIEAIIVGAITGPARVTAPTPTGPASGPVVTGPALARTIAGAATHVEAVTGPERTTTPVPDGPDVTHDVDGPDLARTLTGVGV